MTGEATPARRSPRRAMFVGGSVTVVVMLPTFLTGALAVQLTEDLAFGAAGVGVAVAAFRASGAATSVHLGRLADRLGATWSLRLAAVIAAIASVGIALTAVNLITLVLWLLIAACANTLGQPAANRLLVQSVPAQRQGTAFGLKQSAPPTASMLAGASVPAIALTVGWRWAFVAGGLLALMVLVGIGRRPGGATRRRRAEGSRRAPLRDRPTLLILAVAFGMGTAASSTVAAFYVVSAVRAGTASDLAGTLLAVGSIAAIGVRVVAGAVCDRITSGHLRLCAGLLAVGSVGLLLLATNQPTTMAVGLVLALGGAWGFNGVLWYALVRVYADTPGAATGAVNPGGLLGATISPVLFGVIVEGIGYPAAWSFAAVMALLAAGAMVAGARRLARPTGPAAA